MFTIMISRKKYDLRSLSYKREKLTKDQVRPSTPFRYTHLVECRIVRRYHLTRMNQTMLST